MTIIFYSENVQEYKSNVATSLLTSNDKAQSFTSPHHHQQNQQAEILN